MIEVGPRPTIGRVALDAGLAELPIVFVIGLMTGDAALGRARVLVAGMAGRAGNLGVFPNKGVRRGVIKGNRLPASRRVALIAGLAKLPTVAVVRLVAGVAVLWGALVLAAGVA